MDREERDIMESVSYELHGISLALEGMVDALGDIALALKKDPACKPQPAVMDKGLDALFVSRRAENCLRRAGCRTIADVARKSANSLACTRGVGAGVLQEVRTAMGRLGLRLAGD